MNNENDHTDGDTSTDGKNDRGTRKRLRNERDWKKNVKKSKVNTGKIGRKSEGRQFGENEERNVGESCRCKKKCGENISEEQRKQIFDGFWGMNNKDRRRDFVISHVRRFPKKGLPVKQATESSV